MWPSLSAVETCVKFKDVLGATVAGFAHLSMVRAAETGFAILDAAQDLLQEVEMCRLGAPAILDGLGSYWAGRESCSVAGTMPGANLTPQTEVV